MCREEFKNLLISIVPNCYEGYAAKALMPYLVWQPMTSNKFYANDRPAETERRYIVSYFTNRQDDPAAAELTEAFDDSGIIYQEDIDYNEKEKRITHTFLCRAI